MTDETRPLRVHLVHAHPEPRSFVAAMRDTVRKAFVEQGHTVTVSDLYEMKFNPVASAADFTAPQRPDYLVYGLEQRHAASTGGLSADIEAEVDNVLAADILAFTFPIFWFDTPAILKGWIDRVFLSGAFYGGRRVYDRGGLVGKRAFAAMSLGGRAHMFGSNAIHGELEAGMLRHFFQGTLGYVGLQVHQPFTAYHVPYVDDHKRAELLGDLHSCVTRLDTRQFIPMPSLDDYDSTFKPLP